MKKIIYSNFTKFLAVILFIICIAFGTFIASNGFNDYRKEEKFIYQIDRSFGDSVYFSGLLEATEVAVTNAYLNFDTLDKGKTIEEIINTKLAEIFCLDKINYYIKLNDTIFTNCGAISEEELVSAEFHSFIKRNENGDISISSTQQNFNPHFLLGQITSYDSKTSTKTSLIISTSIKDDYINECRVIWERQFEIINSMFAGVLICLILALMIFIYLISVCGKTKDGDLKSLWLDNVWIEVHIVSIYAVGRIGFFLSKILLEKYLDGLFSYLFTVMLAITLTSAVCVIILSSVLSAVRNIKRKRLIQSSAILGALAWIFKALRRIRSRVIVYRDLIFKAMQRKTGVILIVMLLAYTAILILIDNSHITPPLKLLFMISLFIFALFIMARRTKDLEEIKTGAREIRNGNTNYKIPELYSEDLRILSTDINDIAKGLDDSIAAKLSAERLKNELITNVSHDLKTPITSIINYTELLSKTDGLPEEAKDYVSIISKKSDRLKNLTQDLFDISKVQSGNETVDLSKIDLTLLINQSLGEHDTEINSSDITFCVDIPKKLHILADGRKMSRVISNLISNILKYSMKHTRAFITAFENEDTIILEFKNISSYPMIFTADEIVGRFVRGDSSRTKDGNGLGLAIAKSYTELCNGTFEVVLDGDMFKVFLKFNKHKEE